MRQNRLANDEGLARKRTRPRYQIHNRHREPHRPQNNTRSTKWATLHSSLEADNCNDDDENRFDDGAHHELEVACGEAEDAI